MKGKNWERGVNVTVSRAAHATMKKKAESAKPKLTLRQHVNIINKLPKDA